MSWLLTVLKALARTGLPMKHGMGIGLQLLSFSCAFAGWGMPCLAHGAILEDLPSCRTVRSAHLFIPHPQPPHAPSLLNTVQLRQFQTPNLVAHLGKF